MRATRSAWAVSTAMPFAGCLIPSSVINSANRSRFSATSMESTLVPMIFTPAASNGLARLSGVCPPNWTMVPSGRIRSWMLSTSSVVSGSKNRWSEVS